MRQARAVSVRCPGRGPWRTAQLTLVASTVAVVTAWASSWGLSPAWAPLGLGAGLAAALAAARRWPPVEAHLQWTGAEWRCDDESLVAVEVMLDLGFAVLLRLHKARPGRPAAWVMVTATDAGADFRPLCAALHARPR